MEAWLKGDVKVCGLCGPDSPRCNDPGNGTLYDTAKFCGGLWNETERVKALEALGLLDTPQEEFFDSVTRMLMKMFDTQCSHLVLIDPARCWFKSWQGRWCEFETSTDHGPNVECLGKKVGATTSWSQTTQNFSSLRMLRRMRDWR